MTEAREFREMDKLLGTESWSDKDDAFVRAKLVLHGRASITFYTCEFVPRYLKYKRYHESESFKSLWSDPPDGYTREEWMTRYGKTPQMKDDENHPTSLRGRAQRICDYLRLPDFHLASPDVYYAGYHDDDSDDDDSFWKEAQRIREQMGLFKPGDLMFEEQQAERDRAERAASPKLWRAKKEKRQVTLSIQSATYAMESVRDMDAILTSRNIPWTRRVWLVKAREQRFQDIQLDIVRARRQRAKADAVLFKVENRIFFEEANRRDLLHVADETFLDKYREGPITEPHTDRENSNKKRKRETVIVEVRAVMEKEYTKTLSIDFHDYEAIVEMGLLEGTNLRCLDNGWRTNHSALNIDCDVTEDGRIWRCTFLNRDCDDDTIDHISELSELKLLTLQSCDIEFIPSSFGNLQNLQVFRLVDTYVRGLPDEIGNLTSLKVLDLSYSRIMASLPISIGNLKQLEEINLDYTFIEELPVEFYNDSSLRRFYANTHLGFRIPPEIQRMKKLECFHVCVVRKRDLPREMTNLESLTELHVKTIRGGYKIISIPDEIKYTISRNRFKAKASFGDWTESTEYTNKLWPLMLSKAKFDHYPQEDAMYYLLQAGRGSFLNMLTNSRQNACGQNNDPSEA